MSLELYYFDQCPFCQRVLGTLRDLELTERVTMKNILAEPAYRRELAELTGRTTVPCLKIDGKPMFESADITAWLESNRAQVAAG